MNSNKDLYNILELDNNATNEQIKQNYRKLALRYHPDRWGNKSEKEQKEAEEKFKEISWAYSILSDPEKKQRYDQFGITDDQQNGGFGSFDPGDLFRHFMGGFGNDDGFGPFGNFFNNRKRNNQNYPQQGQSIRLQIPVSIQDLLNGINRTIDYDILVRCDKCNGVGGEDVETCQHCHGTGMITETNRTAFGIIQNSHPCQYCGGEGKVIKHKCSKCHGSGQIKKSASIKINISPGFDNDYQKLYKGKGYESNDLNGPNGDLLLQFIYAFDTSKYAVQGYNIYEKIEVPYYNCILGGTFEGTLPNGEKIKYTINKYSNAGSVININKKFGKFTYNYIINVKMPKYINKKEQELLENIKKENS